MSKYTVEVWTKAKRDAELEIMRATPTLDGGRKSSETIIEYVARARRKQDEAVAHYQEACEQLKIAQSEILH